MHHISTLQQTMQVGLSFRYREGINKDAPLVVFVHGRAGNYDVMWTFERCIPPSATIVAFQAPLADQMGGFSWWEVSSKKVAEVVLEKSSLMLEKAIVSFQDVIGIQPKIRIGIGFSQGAGLLVFGALRGLFAFNGVAILAGFIPYKEQGLLFDKNLKFFMAHGTEDQVATIDKARTDAEYLKSLGYDLDYIEDHVAHKVGLAGTRALKRWIHSIEAFNE